MKREEIEWSQFYWFDSSRSDLKRVLLIGDSIVAGSREYAAKKLSGKATVAAFSTSKIVGDPAIHRELMISSMYHETRKMQRAFRGSGGRAFTSCRRWLIPREWRGR